MLTSRTLNVWARDRGVDLTTIGLFSLVSLPYAYKFAWAPLMDGVRLPILGRRRGWLLVTQLALLASILAMAVTGPREADTPLMAFAICSLMVAFFSASQDIVADAYRTDVLTDAELGPGASVYMTGYRIAMLGAGAGAVALAAHLEWMWVYMLAACGMSVGVVSTLFVKEPLNIQPPQTFADAVIRPFADFLIRNRWRTLIVLLFIVLFKLPDYMASRMIDPLLLDIGFTKQQIAFWALGVGIAVTIPGVLVGGPIVARLGLTTALFIVGLAQALSNVGYMILANVGAVHWLMILVVGVEYFCTGLVVAGFVAFLMSQCNRQFSATQFALLSSVMGLSNSLAGVPTGWLVERTGYGNFFLITILAGVPGMLLIPFLRLPQRSFEEVEDAAPPR
jgi:PAT family beta-lactamase induction signal transducer AmpG